MQGGAINDKVDRFQVVCALLTDLVKCHFDLGLFLFGVGLQVGLESLRDLPFELESPLINLAFPAACLCLSLNSVEDGLVGLIVVVVFGCLARRLLHILGPYVVHRAASYHLHLAATDLDLVPVVVLSTAFLFLAVLVYGWVPAV